MIVAAEKQPSSELVLSHLDGLPTLPAVALRLLAAGELTEPSATAALELLGRDRTLTARVLSAARMATGAAHGPVVTLDEAVALLGFAGVRSVVLAAAAFDCFASMAPEAESGAFNRSEFWRHSLAVACAGRQLARQRADLGVDAADAFVAGLLHDLGKVALAAVFPKAYDRIVTRADHSRGDIADSERAILGVDHTVAGRRLAERWRLPPALQEAVWLHHLAADALPRSVSQPRLIGVVQLADTLARERRVGWSGNHVFCELSPGLGERLGFSVSQTAAVAERLESEVTGQRRWLELDAGLSLPARVDHMARANVELGRANEDLTAGNRRLVAGARYFQAQVEFERHLSDWADPAAVVAAMARSATLALRQPHGAAFGLRDRASALDTCWVGVADGACRHVTRAISDELGGWLDTARGSSDLLITVVPPALRELLDPDASLADQDTLWLLPVFHEAGIVGGIVYPAEADQRIELAEESDELRSFLASLGLALARANAQAAARRLSEDLADTNRRLQRMQIELLRSRTLSMIAEMAAGAGHELNTPLSVISGRAQMLAATQDDEEVKRVLRMISEKAHECSGIVSELLDFARPRTPRREVLDLDELLAELRAGSEEASGLSASQLSLESPRQNGPRAAPAMILADREQIHAVFNELLRNAADAVSKNSGHVVLRYQDAVEPEMVELLVEDAGCGMSPAVLHRAFDPFYSHRNAGRGRGLGLPRAYRIVEAHDGRIWLESRPDEGTTAHVLLPRGTE